MAEQQKSKHTMDLTEGPILKKVIIFSVPLVLSSIFQLLFNAVDAMVVGKFAGDNSLAAVSSNGPIINLITNIFMGLSIGGNVLVARYFASKEEDKLTKVVHTSITISTIFGVLLIVLGWFMTQKLLEWTNCQPGVIELAKIYLRIYFFGMPATMIYNFGAAILRGVGDTKRPMIYLVIAGVINVALNLLLVIVFRLDVVGVAVATVVSQTISAILVVKCLLQEVGAIQLQLKKLGVHFPTLWNMMKIGIPSGIQSSMFSLSNVVVQSNINSFGNIVMSGNGAAQNLESFLAVSIRALSQATISFVSQNVGAKKYARIDRIVITIILCGVIIDAISGNLVYLLGEQLVGLYSNSPVVIKAGVVRLGIACSFHFIYAMMDIMAGALRGMGRTIVPMIVSILGVCVFRVAWVSMLGATGVDYGIEAIYWTYPMSWALTLLAHTVYYFISKALLKKKAQT